MLSRINRLGSEKDISRLFGKGKFAGARTLTVKAIRRTEGQSRFAFVVGTKVSKRAVERNRARRRMREIVRLNLGKIVEGFDIAIIAKKDILTAAYAEIERDMATAMHKLGLLQPNKDA